MSDSDSEYSDSVDMLDQLINEENKKAANTVEIKEENIFEIKVEKRHADDTDSSDHVEHESDKTNPSAVVSNDKKKSKLNHKEQMKLRKLRERELRTEVFGDKKKFLHNLKITAEGGAKKRKKTTHNKRKPVWNDSDDEGLDVITRVETKEIQVTRKETYKKQLENKFQRILGTPAWADLDRKNCDDDDSDDEILRTIGHLAHPKSERLIRGQLTFKRLKDLNRETYGEGPSITGVEFHPTSSVSLVTGTRGVATIYSIDGKKNDKLHSMAFDNYPIRCCRLNKDGIEAIFGGSQKYFYTYDLLSGHTERIFLPKTITKLTNFEVSPCNKYIAVIGRFGEIHLLHASTKELICTLKQEHLVTSVAFSIDSKYLFAHCVDSEVNIFDIGEQRLNHRFIDDGCINGTTITISPNGQLVAASSKQGVVNVYNYSNVITERSPRPEKTILNLTTAISSTKFNHTSEMLAIASKEVDDAVKIVHFPSGTVFSNFPGNLPKIGKPHVIQFSPQGGYLAIGSHAKEVPLYRLKHFNNY